MRISELVIDKLKYNNALDAYVKSVASRVSDHVSSNRMDFFPEYTDHSVTHFQNVLETAIDLITEPSFNLLTDVDFAILTTSVMLHDLGMHLTKDGFQTLIDPTGPLKPIDGFDETPWHSLWHSFLSEARRFNETKLAALFGENYKPVTDFPLFDDSWSEFDYLLVGEFIRRHHPRLAHEIALRGMPAKDGSTIRFCAVDSENAIFISNMSGLVARSHGMALRQTFPYLTNHYQNKIEVRSAHPVYLMTLLRVADYLQIQSSRAPSARTDVSKLKSPVSNREWSLHQSVIDINNTSDPEAIDIMAQPKDVTTFIQLKKWIVDLQKEIDTSWAVLGEVYGLQSHNGLNKFGLRIRRINSNIDNVKAFSRTVNFVPDQIAFTSAESDLLKLLIGPLYANEIFVGLRELIQNATDAVKEIDSLVKECFIKRPDPRSDMSCDVQVQFILENQKQRTSSEMMVKEIVFTDRGVGMTSEIIKEYFLKAGASFRNSNTWKEHFQRSDGSSRVQRSGRFGIGALAAFLLGDEITVETRHYSQPRDGGLKFSATIDSTSINVIRTECDVGTKIRIVIPKRLQKEVGRLLPNSQKSRVDLYYRIGHYFGRYPSLIYKIENQCIDWDERCLLPLAGSRFEYPWNTFETDDFDVNWTFDGDVAGLSVNQILVSRRSGWYDHDGGGGRKNSFYNILYAFTGGRRQFWIFRAESTANQLRGVQLAI